MLCVRPCICSFYHVATNLLYCSLLTATRKKISVRTLWDVTQTFLDNIPVVYALGSLPRSPYLIAFLPVHFFVNKIQ